LIFLKSQATQGDAWQHLPKILAKITTKDRVCGWPRHRGW
jgi:hypothetical protein